MPVDLHSFKKMYHSTRGEPGSAYPSVLTSARVAFAQTDWPQKPMHPYSTFEIQSLTMSTSMHTSRNSSSTTVALTAIPR